MREAPKSGAENSEKQIKRTSFPGKAQVRALE
jgi:hypothetical protein